MVDLCGVPDLHWHGTSGDSHVDTHEARVAPGHPSWLGCASRRRPPYTLGIMPHHEQRKLGSVDQINDRR